MEPPASEGWSATIMNETLSLTSNISVRNGGLLAFNDSFFVLPLYGDNGPLVELSSNGTDLRTNTWVRILVTFEINKSVIGENALQASKASTCARPDHQPVR